MKLHRNIRLLAWHNFFTDFHLYSAIAILYFSKITHSLALGMSIFSIASVAGAFFEVPTGVLSDLVGRRKTVILGSLAAVMYSIFYAIGTNYFFLATGAIFQGLSFAFYSGNNNALLHDTLSEVGHQDSYHRHLGKLSSFFQLALALGALLGSILASQSFALIMWLSVIPQLICFFISFKLVEPKIKIEKTTNVYAHLKEATKLFFTNRKLRLISLATMIGGALGEVSFQFQAAFYQILWPLWAIGVAKMFSYLGATVSFFFSGRLIDKFKEIKIILAGNIYSRIINSIAVLVPSKISPILMSSSSLFYGATSVSQNSLLQKEFSSDKRATIASLNSLGESTLFAIFAFLFGLVGDWLGPAKTLFIIQIISLIGTYFYFKFYKVEKS